MDNSYFDDVVEGTLDKARLILRSKNGAYNPNEDKLHIFKRTAMLRNTTPQGALSGMMAKHTGSVYDMCESDQTYSMDVWDEKIFDHINYLILLRAIMIEQANDGMTASDEALAALREKLRSEPNVILHEPFPEDPELNNHYMGVEKNHVDEEIYTNR